MTKVKIETSVIFKSDIANMTITVPTGFPTDLASIPRIPIIYELIGNTSKMASVIHDFLYTSKLVNRKMADSIFLEACVVTHVPSWRRIILWSGIRIFGKSYW